MLHNLTLAVQISQLQRPLSFILVAILLTKTGFSPYEIGLFETLLFVATTLNILGLGTFVSSLLPIFAEATEQNQQSYIKFVYYVVVFSNMFIVSVLYFFNPSSIFLITGQIDLPYFSIFCIYLFFHFPAGIADVILLLFKDAKKLFFLSSCNFFSMIISVLVAIYYDTGIVGILKGWILYAMFKNCFLIYYLYKKQVFQASFLQKSLIIKYVIFVFPLLINAFIGGFASNTDSWIINWFTSGNKEIFGIYKYGAREVPFINAFCIGLSNVMVLTIANNFTEGMAELKQKSTLLMHKIFSAGVLLLLFSPWLYQFIFSKAFITSAEIFNIYILLIIHRFLFSNTILYALKDNKAILTIGVFELFLNIIFSLVFVQLIGIKGVAWGTVLAYTLERTIMCCYVYIKYDVPIHQYCNVKVFLSYSALLLVAYVASTFIFQWFVG